MNGDVRPRWRVVFANADGSEWRCGTLFVDEEDAHDRADEIALMRRRGNDDIYPLYSDAEGRWEDASTALDAGSSVVVAPSEN